jgi:AMMECR1 domain-containing protein
MALTEETIEDQIEIVGEFKAIQIREAIIIKRDGTEISRSFHRHVVMPDISAEDLAKESADVQAIAAQVHTDEIKTAYNAHLQSMIIESE